MKPTVSEISGRKKKRGEEKKNKKAKENISGAVENSIFFYFVFLERGASLLQEAVGNCCTINHANGIFSLAFFF